MVSRVSFSGLRSPGETSALVETLRGLGTHRSIPIGLLAGFVGRTETEVRRSLQILIEKNAVTLDRDNDTVKLVA